MVVGICSFCPNLLLFNYIVLSCDNLFFLFFTALKLFLIDFVPEFQNYAILRPYLVMFSN